MSRFYCFVRMNALVFLTIACFSLVFAGFRLAFIDSYGGSAVWQSASLAEMFVWGLRIDARTLAIMLALPWLLSLAYFVLSLAACEALTAFQCRFMQWMLTIATALEIINHYYFRNFQNHIDIFLFQVLDLDNAIASLKSAWGDYPILSAIAVLWVLHKLYGKGLFFVCRRFRAYEAWHGRGLGMRTAYAFVSLLLLFLLIRGSVSTFPLTLNRVAIAGDRFLTQAVANGPMALSEAFSDWRRLKRMQPVSDAEALAAYREYFGHAPADAKLKLDDLLQPASHPSSTLKHPDIVMVQMESMGGGLLDTHQAAVNDLWGRLHRHIQQDFYFSNFSPLAMGTLMTLEKILLNSGFDNISKTPYRDVAYRFSVARVLQQAGYETLFITAGHKTWGQIDALLSHQGFDHVLGGDDILQALPEAIDDGTWGVFDHYLYDYIVHRLQMPHAKPLFIYAMPVSNHLPYILPADYQPAPVHLPAAWIPRLVDADQQRAKLILQSLQYANDALGGFIDTVKAYPDLAAKTVIAATGDHNMRDLIFYRAANLGQQHRVPFYLYLPTAYAEHTVRDVSRIGSHKDIFPSIFRHALPDLPSYGLGEDLLSADFKQQQAVAISTDYWMNAEGCASMSAQQTVYYRWRDQLGQLVSVLPKPSAGMLKAERRYRAYYTLQRWQMYRQVQAQQAHED